ncbi:Lsr2 family DNA-binding protein [Nonomuraea sp. CA-141351]|uniref:Lsr2 family DNA-binding protein n=1 Tax=Nonomuraea sp. CA-141351 TaxID=3239996 RepID=UPI003D89E879
MPRELVEKLWCDFCYQDGEKKTEATETIKINGKQAYACERDAKPILKALEAFEAVAERIPTETARPSRGGRSRAARGGSSAAAGTDAPTTTEVRAWAQANNIPVSAKARVASDVWEKFYDAFPDRRPAS